jgi:5-methylcytosine-specific restriction endonuclease McrA
MKKHRAFNTELIKYVIARDEGTCVYCGNPGFVVDHVIPSSKGGPSIRSNAVCTCKKCNYIKRDKLEINVLTRAIFWLSTHGEDTSWMDDFHFRIGI